MATYSLQLLGFHGKYEGEGAPYGPRAYIALKSYGVKEFPVKAGKEKASFNLITPDCVAFQEFDYEVNRLIKELKTIRSQGTRFFKKDKEKKEKAFGKREFIHE